MTIDDARELAHQTNPAMLGVGDGPFSWIYTESVERGTLDWDHLEMDSGRTYLETALTGVYEGDRW